MGELDVLIEEAKQRGKLELVEGLLQSKNDFEVRGYRVIGPSDEAKSLGSIYANKVRRSQNKLIDSLEDCIIACTKADDIDGAKRIKAELDVLQKRELKGIHGLFDKIAGQWTGFWGTSRSPFSMTIKPDGSFLMRRFKSSRVDVIDGRFLLLSFEGDQKMEFIRNGDCLIVLGWTTGKGRDPLSKEGLEGTPDHVATLHEVVLF